MLHVPGLAGDLQVSACAAPADKPCQIFSATAVPASGLQLQPITGSAQLIPVGQSFQPVAVRVTDNAIPSHPVSGANVTFEVVVSRPVSDPPPVAIGGIIITGNPPPVIVSSSRVSVVTDAAGQATVVAPNAEVQGAVMVQGTAAAGASVLPFQLLSLSPAGH